MSVLACVGVAGSCAYTAFQLTPDSVEDFPRFLWGMLAIFFFAGVGNASTFKQMPSIFERRQSGGVIGFTSAIAAFGPFFFSVILASTPPVFLFGWWTVLSIVGAVLAWWYYARKGAEKPS